MSDNEMDGMGDNWNDDAMQEDEDFAPENEDKPHVDESGDVREDGIDFIAADEVKNQKKSNTKEVPKDLRQTTPFMTKYERARVLGTRALHIAMSAPVMVELEGETDPLRIAMKELKAKKIPIIIRRYLPDQSYEDWAVDELIIEGEGADIGQC